MQWLLTAHVRRYHRHYHSTKKQEAGRSLFDDAARDEGEEEK